jgi:hypothetical protein
MEGVQGGRLRAEEAGAEVAGAEESIDLGEGDGL